MVKNEIAICHCRIGNGISNSTLARSHILATARVHYNLEEQKGADMYVYLAVFWIFFVVFVCTLYSMREKHKDTTEEDYYRDRNGQSSFVGSIGVVNFIAFKATDEEKEVRR